MKEKSNLLFLHKLIKSFADSLVKIFVPIIILQNSESMYNVVLYLIVFYTFAALFNFVLKKFLQKYGVIAIILHVIPLIAIQFLLTLPSTWWLCVILGLLASIDQAFYFVPLNILFSFTDKKADVSKFQISTCVGKLLFILLSGFILSSNIKNSVLVLAIIGTALYLVSTIPLLYGFKLLKTEYVKIVQNKPQIDKKSYLKHNVFSMCFSVYKTTLEVVLPLYLFVNNLNFQAISIVLALIEVCKILTNLLAKFMYKKRWSFWGGIASLILFFTGLILLFTVKNVVVLYISSCLISLTFPLIFVPSFATFVKKASSDNNVFDGMTYRDIYIQSAKPILFVPYLIIPSFIAMFGVGAVSSILMIISFKQVLKDS